jgi:3D (Asp-Asp-Asp) domain-containing protein
VIMEEKEFAYAARDENNHCYGITADDVKYKNDTADIVAEWIREGARIIRVPVEVAREIFGQGIENDFLQAQQMPPLKP